MDKVGLCSCVKRVTRHPFRIRDPGWPSARRKRKHAARPAPLTPLSVYSASLPSAKL